MAAACPTSWPEATPAGTGRVSALDARRIERALPRRARYKYVHPRVLREGAGWKVVCPNCSRSVDPQGGEIDIAWLVPAEQGGWLLHARDHRQGAWVLKQHATTLSALLTHLCWDADREFWQ
jgi:hypothetical protein